jgi:hypothetical protein
MKKLLIVTISLILGFTSSYAQLKVFGNGTVRLAPSTSALVNSLVQIGDTVVASNSDKIGLSSSISSKSSYCCTSIKGITVPTANNYCYNPIGVWGEAGGGIFCSYGVVGQVTGIKAGAGVYGLAGNASITSIFSGQYAGLFNGETKVMGDFTATNVYTTSDIRLKENVSAINDGESDMILDKLMDVNVIKYNLKKEAFGYNDNDTREIKGNATNLVHFGVSAQQLQELYPNLVKEGQDGYLAVNYTELVPVLIRSIQELKQELDDLKDSDESRMTRSAFNTGENHQLSAKNKLYQNTPNPFKERTTIHFHITDDVKDASICIFDMTGKMLKKLPISSGESSVSVNGWELGEGMFLYTLIVNGIEIDTKKMIITK